ncbi:hypothetical protein D3C87_1243480 [compost metagenome]
MNFSRLISVLTKPSQPPTVRLTLPPSSVENSGFNRFDLALSTPNKVLRILSCASVCLGSAATAVALSRVVRLTGPPDNNAPMPAATLVVTGRLTVTCTAAVFVASAANARRLPAPVCKVPQLTTSVLSALTVNPLRVALCVA